MNVTVSVSVSPLQIKLLRLFKDTSNKIRNASTVELDVLNAVDDNLLNELIFLKEKPEEIDPFEGVAERARSEYLNDEGQT